MGHRGFEKSNVLRAKGQRLIPGGAHTYAKGDDQFPLEAPAFFVRGEGCRAWDTEGRCFVEYGMGLRSVTLGHGFRPVVDAAATALSVRRRVRRSRTCRWGKGCSRFRKRTGIE